MTQNYFYVVWEGYQTGVFPNWTIAKKQVNGYPNAKFKKFKSYEAAYRAYNMGYDAFIDKLSRDKGSSTTINFNF